MAPAASPASAIASHSDSAGLALDDQKTRLVERLRERYEKLSPLTVEVGRAVRALDPVTGRPRTAASPTSDRAFRLRLLRMGDRMAVRIFWDVPDGTYISHNAKWAWVDDRFRMFSPKDDIGTPVGQIRGQPLEVRTLDSPGQHAYFQLAGLFANEVDTTRSMASGTGATSPWWKWFSQAADELGLKVADVDAAEDAVPGEVAHSGRLIRCELGRRGSHPSIDTIWLDPSKGYMPVRSRKEWFAGRPGSFEAKPYHTKTHRVIEAKEVAPGIWMPTRTTHTTEAPRNPDPLVQEEFVVRDLSMEPLPADAFSVEFPPGTEVIDWINQVCYRVLPDGRVAPRPFIPAPNAPMVESPPALVEESVKQNPPYDGFVFRGIADESEMASAVTPRASVTMWLLPSLAGLVGIGGVLIYRKLRPMS